MRKLFATLLLLLATGSASAQSLGQSLSTSNCSPDGTCGILRPGQYLENGIYLLLMQSDGNLVLYENFSTTRKPVWASNTDGKGGTYAVIQHDGNLVIYRPNGSGVAPVWATNTGGKPYQYASVNLDNKGAITLLYGLGPTYDKTTIYAGPGPNGGETGGTCSQPRQYPVCAGRWPTGLQLVVVACSESEARRLAAMQGLNWGGCL